MTKTLTAVAAALALVGAHSAFAASTSSPASTSGKSSAATAETCRSLEAQYDSAMKTHSNAKRAKEARAAHAEGKKLCDEGKYAEGTAKLHTALKDLGVKATGKMQ